MKLQKKKLGSNCGTGINKRVIKKPQIAQISQTLFVLICVIRVICGFKYPL
jgi:hypothetical protein